MNKKHYHFIGIGGIGMSGIAKLFLREGALVSGSDLKPGEVTRSLEALGARVFAGHDEKNIGGADIVVYSSAIRADNPELAEARRLGIPVIKRAQALAHLMEAKTVITISGSHGKTTTSSLISCLLIEAGLSPTAVVGGVLKNIDTNACGGCGSFFVAEADESDGSFLFYRPKYCVITNIDREHLDYYQDFPSLLDAFRQFACATDPAGCLFCCGDDLHLLELAKDYRHKYRLFGLSRDCHVRAENIVFKGLSSEFDVFLPAGKLGRFSLSLGGRHNISNALAAVALGLELGIEAAVIKKTLVNYKGAGRRIEIKFENRDYLLIDDYAHHPTEIKATLDAVQYLKRNRIVAVFQPHRYSRTQILMQEFAQSFDLADCLILTDIYAASETPIAGVSGRALSEKIKEITPHKDILFLEKKQITEHILKIRRPGDVIITLGAGDITKICDELAERF